MERSFDDIPKHIRVRISFDLWRVAHWNGEEV